MASGPLCSRLSPFIFLDRTTMTVLYVPHPGITLRSAAMGFARIGGMDVRPVEIGRGRLVDGGEVVGFTGFGPSRDDDAGADVGEVTSIYLAPQRWGRGGGRLLMRTAVDR